MSPKVVLSRAHQFQLQGNAQFKSELQDVQEYLDKQIIVSDGAAVVLLPLLGRYVHLERKTNIAFLLINKAGFPLSELHAVIRFYLPIENVQLAKATLDLDEPFLGYLASDEALLLHLNVPTKGLTEDAVFPTHEIKAAVNEVRVTKSTLDSDPRPFVQISKNDSQREDEDVW